MTQSGHCNDLVPARRSEPFAGPPDRFPDGRVRIVGADDGNDDDCQLTTGMFLEPRFGGVSFCLV